MFTIDLKTDLTVCEKIYLLCWTVPKKIMVLLAFSYFPTYSESVLLLNSPLLISCCINSRPTRRPTGLTTILHNNQNIWLLCKIVVRPVGRLVRLELMRQVQVLSSHSFYGFDINVFSTISYNQNSNLLNTMLDLLQIK